MLEIPCSWTTSQSHLHLCSCLEFSLIPTHLSSVLFYCLSSGVPWPGRSSGPVLSSQLLWFSSFHIGVLGLLFHSWITFILFPLLHGVVATAPEVPDEAGLRGSDEPLHCHLSQKPDVKNSWTELDCDSSTWPQEAAQTLTHTPSHS